MDRVISICITCTTWKECWKEPLSACICDTTKEVDFLALTQQGIDITPATIKPEGE